MDFKERNKVLGGMYSLLERMFWDDLDVHENLVRGIIDNFKTSTNYTLDELPERLQPFEEDCDIFSVEDWNSEGVKGCAFTPSDGCGYWATDEGYSYNHADIFEYQPKWATKVAWYNC